jgi:hypothetical protein
MTTTKDIAVRFKELNNCHSELARILSPKSGSLDDLVCEARMLRSALDKHDAVLSYVHEQLIHISECSTRPEDDAKDLAYYVKNIRKHLSHD